MARKKSAAPKRFIPLADHQPAENSEQQDEERPNKRRKNRRAPLGPGPWSEGEFREAHPVELGEAATASAEFIGEVRLDEGSAGLLDCGFDSLKRSLEAAVRLRACLTLAAADQEFYVVTVLLETSLPKEPCYPLGCFALQGDSLALTFINLLQQPRPYVTLKPEFDPKCDTTARLRVGILNEAFDDSPKGPNDISASSASRKRQADLLQMVHWLLPHLQAPASPGPGPYGLENSGSFDAKALYRAVRPSVEEPELQGDTPALRPSLRPYQRRAVAWMVAREQGCQSASRGPPEPSLHPLWREVVATSSLRSTEEGSVYINPFTGAVSRSPFMHQDSVRGGILAEEMGLGKTVEILALVLSHRPSGPLSGTAVKQKQEGGEATVSGALRVAKDEKGEEEGREPRGGREDRAPQVVEATGGAEEEKDQDQRWQERVDCVCGAFGDPDDFDDGYYEGEWVQCDSCDAWLHADCLGITNAAKQLASRRFECGGCVRRAASRTVKGTSGATLIICPASILPQWTQEVAKHSVPGALRVVVYQGQAQWESYAAGLSGTLVTPADLAAADLVLTSYEVLRRELHYESSPEEGEAEGEGSSGGRGRTLRGGKKYPVLPTPLTRLRWWRVCLDEAQMVESSTAKAAEMALKLDAINRWAVSGTPISRGLEDLHGLMVFLRLEPWSSGRWWRAAVAGPAEAGGPGSGAALVELLRPSLGGLMWRSSKRDVAGEIGIPVQHEHRSPLELSAVERHFYNVQHQQCRASASGVLRQGLMDPGRRDEESLRPLTAREEKKLLGPLLRLRQACCHPQVGSGGIRSLTDAGGLRTPMTMGEILGVLVGKARVEAEESMRRLMLSLNGLGACMVLEGNRTGAVSAYREALALAEENKPELAADSLQRLHTLHNLGELLSEGVDGVAPTLRDGSMEDQKRAIRDKYLAQWAAKLEAADSGFREAADAGGLLLPLEEEVDGGKKKKFKEGGVEGWWLPALDWLAARREGGEVALVDAFRDHLLGASGETYLNTTNQNASSIARRFRNVHGFKAVLSEELKSLDGAKGAALSDLEGLRSACSNPTQALVEQAGQCSQCREEVLGVAGHVCRHCRLDQRFLDWELRLFKLHSSSLQAGKAVSAEQVARAAQRAALTRVGRGGLHEAEGAQGLMEELPESRRDGSGNAVSTTNVVRHPSEAETALQWILSQLRASRSSGEDDRLVEGLLQVAGQHLKRLEGQRRLFLRARALSLAQRMLLYAHDELGMATMRLRLRAPGEIVKPQEEVFKLHPEEVPARNVDFSRDKMLAAAELRARLGTLRYLKSLQAEQSSAKATLEEAGDKDACPVCQEPLGFNLVMLHCGHKLCCRCTVALVDRIPSVLPKASQAIQCPSCRSRVRVDDGISYINVVPDNQAPESADRASEGEAGGTAPLPWDDAKVSVTGSYGTKLESVVRRVLAILAGDPQAKMLIFSSWADVLSLLAHALEANHVPVAHAHGSRKLHGEIARFRGSATGPSHSAGGSSSPGGAPEAATIAHVGRRGEPHLGGAGASYQGGGRRRPGKRQQQEPAETPVLMLLTQQGANGLNLTEAQHVLMVEPLLDPAVEAQAIGRVHRIGQVHETWVHHFVTDETVEINVTSLGKERARGLSDTGGKLPKGEAARLTVRDMARLLDDRWGDRGAAAESSSGGSRPLPNEKNADPEDNTKADDDDVVEIC